MTVTFTAGVRWQTIAPRVRVLVAFANGPLDDPSTFAVADYNARPTAGTWTDVTRSVKEYQTQGRGRQHDLGQFAASTASLTLDNNDGRFNAWNTAGPYAGLLRPRRWLQIQARATATGAWIPRFTGHVSGWTPLWSSSQSSDVKVDAADPLRLLANTKLQSNAYPLQVVADGAGCLYRLADIGGSMSAQDAMARNPSGSYPADGSITPGGDGPFVTDTAGSASVAAVSVNGTVNSTSEGIFISGGVIPYANGQTSWSLECWWRMIGTGWQAPLVLLWSQTMSSTASVNGAPRFYVQLSGGSSSAGVVTALGGAIGVVTADPNLYDASVGTADNVVPADGRWHHIVVTLSSAATVMYVDGVVVGSFNSRYGIRPPQGSVYSTQLARIYGAYSGFIANVCNVASYPVALTASQIAKHYAIGRRGFLVGTTGPRIGECLAIVGWPDSATALDTGLTTAQTLPGTLVNTGALSAMQALEETEAGALFAGRDGRMVFVDRKSLITSPVYTTSQVTFGDGPAEINFQASPMFTVDDVDIFNVATIQRANGPVKVSATNAPSMAEYGTASWSPNGTILYRSDEEALSRAQYVVTRFGEPLPRIDTLAVSFAGVNPSFYPALLGLDLLSRVTLNRRTGSAGSAFSGQFLVEQIAEHVTPTSWDMTFTLAPIDSMTYSIAGVTGPGAAPYF